MGNVFTQRSLAWCRKQGWNVCISEHWNSFARVRKDLFGFIDMVALTGSSIVAIQSTSYECHNARRNKILDERRENAEDWLDSGGEILLISWKKVFRQSKKKAGEKRNPGRAFVYSPIVENLAPLFGKPTTLLLDHPSDDTSENLNDPGTGSER